MSLFWRLIFIVVVSMALLIVVVVGLSSAFLSNRLRDTEQMVAMEDAQRAELYLREGYLLEIKRQVLDWAMWDDSFAYINSPSRAFERSTLLPQIFMNLRMNLIAFIRRDGQIVYAQWCDEASGQFVSQMPEIGKALLLRVQESLRTKGLTSLDGFYCGQERVLLTAAHPITPSDQGQEANGLLIFARMLGPKDLAGAERVLSRAIYVQPLAEAKVKGVDPAAIRTLSAGNRTSIAWRYDTQAIVYRLIDDMDQEPTVVLKLVSAPLHAPTLDVTRGILLAGMGGSTVVIMILMVVLLRNGILHRLDALERGMRRVAESADLKQRVLIPGDDEITRLGSAFNHMLDRLEGVHHALEESLTERAQLGRIISLGPVIVLRWRIEPGWPVEFVSDNVRMLGYSPEMIQNSMTGMADLIDPEDLDLVRAGKGEVPEACPQEEEVILEYRVRTAGGACVWVEDRSWLQRNTRGQVAHGYSVLFDISERKRAEEELRKAKAKAEQVSAHKSQFLSNVSHEIRTPLNSILGFADLINHEDVSGAVHSQVRMILREGETLLRLIDDLLDLGKIEAGRLELDAQPTRLSEVVEALRHNAELLIGGKAIQFEIRVDASLPTCVVCDALRLQEILLNLVTNAIKFTEEGFVHVLLRDVGRNEDAVEVMFSVTDSGIGIPEDRKTAIFETFTQADGSISRLYGGTGLGTSIARDLVRLMGGEIHLESQPGKGSRFWFTVLLSLVSEQCNHSSSCQHSCRRFRELPVLEEPCLHAGRILVVDDYAPNLMLSTALLRALGQTVVGVESGAEALIEVEKQAFDVILLDLQMPTIDGFEVGRRIRAESSPNQKTPLVALTADITEDAAERAKALGFDAVLHKPVRRMQLVRVLGRWLLKDSDATTSAATRRNTQPQVPHVFSFEKAVYEFGDDEQLCSLAIALFLRNAEVQLDEVEAYLEEEDYESVRRLTHTLCGAAANITAERLAVRIRQINEACKNRQSSATILSMVLVVRQELAKVRACALQVPAIALHLKKESDS